MPQSVYTVAFLLPFQAQIKRVLSPHGQECNSNIWRPRLLFWKTLVYLSTSFVIKSPLQCHQFSSLWMCLAGIFMTQKERITPWIKGVPLVTHDLWFVTHFLREGCLFCGHVSERHARAKPCVWPEHLLYWVCEGEQERPFPPMQLENQAFPTIAMVLRSEHLAAILPLPTCCTVLLVSWEWLEETCKLHDFRFERGLIRGRKLLIQSHTLKELVTLVVHVHAYEKSLMYKKSLIWAYFNVHMWMNDISLRHKHLRPFHQDSCRSETEPRKAH